MNKKVLLFVCLLPLVTGSAFADSFPIKEWATASQNKPILFYLSGDGGLNKFSTALCQSLNQQGYEVVALNSKSYFYDKKTPTQTTTDISNYLTKKLKERSNQQVVIIGYSFGADVVPFILNRLPKDLSDKVLVSFLMASSGSTDFEIHWSDMFGGNEKRDMDVVSELNKLTDKKIVIISSSDEHYLAINRITLKKYTREVLPGGHHFDGDTDEIVKVIVGNLD